MLKPGQIVDVALPGGGRDERSRRSRSRGLTKRFGDRDRGRQRHAERRLGRDRRAFSAPTARARPPRSGMMCGLLTPDGGDGRVLGHDIQTDGRAIKREVGYMTQKFSFYEDLTIEENLSFVAGLYRLRPAAPVGRRYAGRSGADQPQGPVGRVAVGRLEAAAGAGRLHHAPAEAADAGRAHRRRRPQGAARLLGRNPPAGRRGPDGAGLDPLHGRGRALPPDQLHLLWQAGGQRHRGRGGQGRRADHDGADRRPHRRGREAAEGRAGGRADRAVRQHPACRRPRRRSAARRGRRAWRRRPAPRRVRPRPAWRTCSSS